MLSPTSNNSKNYCRFLVVSLIIITIVITTHMIAFEKPLRIMQYHEKEVLAFPASVNVCKQNRTLVIVNGMVRTLGLLWEALLLNVVLPNEPCDVIFSIDGKRKDIPESVISGLGSRVIAILTTEEEKTDTLKEFWLTKRTIDKIDFNRYHFILKTRTDLYHGARICLKTLFGESDDFIKSFYDFHQTLLEKMPRRNSSVGEALYAWLMTSGMVELIQPMLIDTPSSPFSYVRPHEWNVNLKATLINCSTMENLVMDRMNVENNRKLSQCFAKTLKKHKVVYNIGSTWVQYGHSQHMIPAALKLAEQFGTHTWKDVGFNDSDTMNANQWKTITESQLRLTFFKAGYNLIDLANQPDYDQSFRAKITFQQAKLDKRFLFYLVRGYTVAT